MTLSNWTRTYLAILTTVAALDTTLATERIFTYSYEPETMPQGALEFEQWVTLRTQRTKGGEVQQQNFNRWEIREELEYGVTDNYTVGLYLNTKAESFRDFSRTPPEDVSEFEFAGISLENRYMVLNPAEHPVGLTLYLEPTYTGSEAELEQKIILGQRHGDWKWALNLVHETEWEDNFHETVGEVEATFGLGRQLNPRWTVGLELRNHYEIPEYSEWESMALYAGPVVSYRQEKWWGALTVMPQVWGRNFDGNPDDDRGLELEDHERVNIRLIVGFHF
jgi:hypothetical protein